jgi:hypothetical protein
MMDVRFTLHAKPMGASKILSDHPSEQGVGQGKELDKGLKEEKASR